MDVQASCLSITVDGGATSGDRDHQRRGGDEAAEEGKGRRRDSGSEGPRALWVCVYQTEESKELALSFFPRKLRWFWKASSQFAWCVGLGRLWAGVLTDGGFFPRGSLHVDGVRKAQSYL